MNWSEYFIRIAHEISKKSKDPSSKVGAVIFGPEHEIRSTGYNGFPRGVFNEAWYAPERWERPAKYAWIEHAERNAIYAAAKVGTPLAGCGIAVTWTTTEDGLPLPCVDCTKACIQAGIKTIVGPSNRPWQGLQVWQFEIARQMIKEAGLNIFGIEMPKGVFD